MHPDHVNHQKGHVLKALMGHPKTAKVIRDAVSAPIGSTKRKYAQNVVNIMQKLNPQGYAMDGSGGPGGPAMQYQAPVAPPEMNPGHIPTDGTKGMVIFHKIPKPNITYGKNNGNATASRFQPRPGFDGQGGPGDPMLGFQSFTGSTPNPMPFSSPQSPAPTTTNNTDPFSLFPSGGSFGGGSTPPASSPSSFSIYQPPQLPSTGGALVPNNNPDPSFSSSSILDPINWSNLAMSKPATSASTFSSTGGLPQLSAQQSSAPQPPSYLSQLPDTNATATSGNGSAATNYATYLGVDPSTPLSALIASKGISAVVAAIKQNEGSSPSGVVNNPGNIKYIGAPGQTNSGVKAADGGTFASYSTPQAGDQAIANIIQSAASGSSSVYGASPTLKSFADKYTNTGGSNLANVNSTGTQYEAAAKGQSPLNSAYPNVQDAVTQNLGPSAFSVANLSDPGNPYTKGHTLSQMYDENAKVLDQKYGVTSLQNNLAQLKNEGAGLGGQLNEYIMGRDQFLKDIQGTIDNFKQIAISQHSDNPAQVSADTTYMNYLYTLKGQQQQRYIDFYNGAITQYNGQLQAATDQYSTALSAYEKDLTTADTVTEQQYAMYDKALQDMYTEVQQAPVNAANLAHLQSQTYLANAQAAMDAAKSGGGVDQLTILPKLRGQIIDPKGYAMPGIDLATKIQTLVALNPTMNGAALATTAYQAYADGITNILHSNATTSAGKSIISPALKTKMGNEGMKNFANIYAQGQAAGDSNTMTYAQNQIQAIAQALGNSEGGSLSQNANAVVAGIKTLAGTPMLFGLMGTSLPTKTQFTQQMGGVSSAVTDAVWSAYQQYLKDNKMSSSPVSDLKASQDFSDALLMNQSSTSSRGTPLPPDQVALAVGQLYGTYLAQQAISNATSGAPMSSMSYDDPNATMVDTGSIDLSNLSDGSLPDLSSLDSASSDILSAQ